MVQMERLKSGYSIPAGSKMSKKMKNKIMIQLRWLIMIVIKWIALFLGQITHSNIRNIQIEVKSDRVLCCDHVMPVLAKQAVFSRCCTSIGMHPAHLHKTCGASFHEKHTKKPNTHKWKDDSSFLHC